NNTGAQLRVSDSRVHYIKIYWASSPAPAHFAACFFFLRDTATSEFYTLSLHDALPISNSPRSTRSARVCIRTSASGAATAASYRDRKSTRLNSSHVEISYAVFCLKKKCLIFGS